MNADKTKYRIVFHKFTCIESLSGARKRNSEYSSHMNNYKLYKM